MLLRVIVNHEKQTKHQKPLFQDILALWFPGIFLQNMSIKIPDGFFEIMNVNIKAQGDIKIHVFDVSL